MADTIKVEVHEAHCPGCRMQKVGKIDPLGVMEPQNPSHGTQSKTAPHIGFAQLKAMMQFQEFLLSKEKKP